MAEPAGSRFGSSLVTVDRRRFIFSDAHNPDVCVMVEDADVAELIAFLHQYSESAKTKIRIEWLKGPKC